MSYLVVVLLSLLWLGFFLPGLLQSRRTSSPLTTATTFQESLTRISTGRAVTDADAAARLGRRSRREIARQRDVLTGLIAAFSGAVVLGFAFGGVVAWLAVPTGAALVGYVVVLRMQAAERRLVRQQAATARRTPPAPADDGIVPSVRRRSAAELAQERQQLERIAG